jgi:hypothetical protein
VCRVIVRSIDYSFGKGERSYWDGFGVRPNTISRPGYEGMVVRTEYT